MAKCRYCRSDLDKSSPSDLRCTKCAKNETKYGKPRTCSYCQLPAAFVRGKCVYCSYAERKSGPPRICSNCKLRAAFPKDPEFKGTELLCRLCKTSYKRTLAKAAAGRNDASNSNSPGVMAKKLKSSMEFDNSGIDPLGEQVLIISQLKDQIFNLQKQLYQKDQAILERDKKIASLNAQLMHQEKGHRAKINDTNKEQQITQELLHDKIRSLNKQLASASKTKNSS